MSQLFYYFRTSLLAVILISHLPLNALGSSPAVHIAAVRSRALRAVPSASAPVRAVQQARSYSSWPIRNMTSKHNKTWRAPRRLPVRLSDDVQTALVDTVLRPEIKANPTVVGFLDSEVQQLQKEVRYAGRRLQEALDSGMKGDQLDPIAAETRNTLGTIISDAHVALRQHFPEHRELWNTSASTLRSRFDATVNSHLNFETARRTSF